ncbi:unnamed protein product [Spirodela intermedia]|uniref:Uncharacterized protein n=1 Tax=Spirodela intermedia TaxID=51605 RepID=A0A7I8IXX4_SPIIN|nr:unnamed protein product [Spirodela intermedia]CAA6661851.1 unnamed protein product [Spirodela intermedia]
MAAPSEAEPVALPKEEQKPKIEPLRLPTVEKSGDRRYGTICAIRSAFSGIMEEMSAKQQFIHTAKQMGRRSWSSAKTFAVMGLLFSAAECVVEKARAKHDMTNTVAAGCFTGGAISAKAACAGCAGFAAFSVLIEKFLDRQN